MCGSHHVQEALDIHEQPFANDFRDTAEDALTCPRFPLKLVRCRVCNHMYLSHIADRGDLFSDYLYRSATSKTLQVYFEWMAKKVIEEAGSPIKGNVLEIACNDGSQLDKFKAKGWGTFGVDPAANLVPYATKKGHTVKVGFWGTEIVFPELPPPEELNAIVAQNVFAHVPSPVDFLKQCAKVMGEQTRVYIQTSQCNMHQLGQFDTAYHEHISFFTGHSFHKAALIAGLYITNFELTPIHGTSCLVTFRKISPDRPLLGVSAGLQSRLDEEKRDGLDKDFFYTKFQAKAKLSRSWISSQLTELTEGGYIIGGFGAAAKGMVLLHFMLQGPFSFKLDFVVDDAPLKQNKFCPGRHHARLMPQASTYT